MRIFVTVKANAKEDRAEAIDKTHFRISVKAPPTEGRANEAVIETLACYLKAPKSTLRLISGQKSKRKVIEARSPNARHVEYVSCGRREIKRRC